MYIEYVYMLVLFMCGALRHKVPVIVELIHYFLCFLWDAILLVTAQYGCNQHMQTKFASISKIYNKHNCTKFEVVTAVTVKINMLWNVTPCSLITVGKYYPPMKSR
jgi:hypothetical protein